MTFPRTFPASRVPDPMAAPALRWGVLGTGWIAERFTGSLRRNTRQQVVAVGSRSVASAKEFADRAGIGRAHGSYADLVADPEVDIVYVATPHNFHHEHALLALDAGKHVLVEKPIALNAAQATEVAARAAERGVYCAEALWTFYLPSYDVIRQLLDDGVLGDVRTVLADHGEWFPETHRILRHDLAGGALLDRGGRDRHAAAPARRVGGNPGAGGRGTAPDRCHVPRGERSRRPAVADQRSARAASTHASICSHQV
jgi:predicted dehydrogenase